MNSASDIPNSWLHTYSVCSPKARRRRAGVATRIGKQKGLPQRIDRPELAMIQTPEYALELGILEQIPGILYHSSRHTGFLQPVHD